MADSKASEMVTDLEALMEHGVVGCDMKDDLSPRLSKISLGKFHSEENSFIITIYSTNQESFLHPSQEKSPQT